MVQVYLSIVLAWCLILVLMIGFLFDVLTWVLEFVMVCFWQLFVVCLGVCDYGLLFVGFDWFGLLLKGFGVVLGLCVGLV